MRARSIFGVMAVAALAWATVAAGPVWVSDDGTAVSVTGRHAVVLGEEGGTRFDVADLADGETRVFGTGDRQLTATRNGDEVVLSRPAVGDDPELRTVCRLGTDRCAVVTFDDAPEKVMLIVEKTRHCTGDEAECAHELALDVDVDVDVAGAGGPGKRVIVRKLDCRDGDCTEVEDVAAIAGANGPASFLFLHSGDANEVALRCPEGDAILRVARDEAEETYLCPKHSVPLEKP